MILLLSCSTSWSKSNCHISSTGELNAIPEDSVLVSYEMLKLANAKFIELKYEKEINDSLRSIIVTDDKLIREYNNKVNVLEKQVLQAKRQRNITSGISLGLALSLVVSLIIK